MGQWVRTESKVGQNWEIWHRAERLVYSGFFPSCTFTLGHVGKLWGCLGHDLKNKDVWGTGSATLQVRGVSIIHGAENVLSVFGFCY